MGKIDEHKVLVISNNAFSNVLNNGKTYESLFSGFPKGSYAQLFFNHNEIPDFNFCENYFKITDTDVLKNAILFKRTNGGKCYSKDNNINAKGLNIINPSQVFEGNSKLFLFLKSKAKYLSFFRDYLWKFGTWKTAKLFTWIEDFNPNVIFFIVGSPGYPQDVVSFLVEKYKLPLVIYFTDDYIINAIPRNSLDKLRQNRMKRVYNRTVSSAAVCFAIGTDMCAAYSEYFGKQFSPIMNSVNVIPYVRKNSNSTLIKISYFGGLHLNRWKMISKYGKLLMQIKNSNNINYEFSVYSVSELTKEIADSFKESKVIFRGFVSGNKLGSSIRSSDILLHVESDEMYYRHLTRLSVSTKLPEYLITGNLIIAYGPIEVASLRLFSENGIGVVISSEENEEDVITKLKEILSNKELRLKIGKKGYIYAQKNFDIKKTQEMFIKKVYSV